MDGRAAPGSVRLAELLATLSLAADLGLGQPMEHCIRQTVIALRLADEVGLDKHQRAATYYLGLMMNVYCHADAAEQAQWFGDDIGFKGDGYDTLAMSTPQAIVFLLRQVGSGSNSLERVRRLTSFPRAGMRAMNGFLATHVALASQFAAQVGLDETVQLALRQAYEQWDGAGHPNRLSGEAISMPVRLVQLASITEVFSRARGIEAARAVVRRHRGGIFDPSVADLFQDRAPELLDALDAAASWDAVIDAEPDLARHVSGPELDNVLEAMADLVDLKSPFVAGHSRGVANLAAEAGRISGFSDEKVAALRRAGLVHDLGRLGISNAVWDKAGPLTAAESERVRLHPYLTDRMLARVPALADSREIAARHHERIDGSGYPAGLTGSALSPSDRLLAAADVYHALTEPRPHRPALASDGASKGLSAEVKAGRLDGDAVTAVLRAAGHRAAVRRDGPSGLTSREVEVLGLLARGASNKEIAVRLTVSPKTVSNHVEHIYTKIDVSSRAAATLYAMQQGLVGSFEVPKMG